MFQQDNVECMQWFDVRPERSMMHINITMFSVKQLKEGYNSDRRRSTV
jgi:hypothetical protein